MEYAELLYRHVNPEFEYLYQMVKEGKEIYVPGRLNALYDMFANFKFIYEEKVIGEHAYCNLLRQYRELLQMDSRERVHPAIEEIKGAILNHLPNNVAFS